MAPPRTLPLPDFDKRTAFFGKQAFIYEAHADRYRCPAGTVLPPHTAKYTERVVLYQADAATCNACPIKAKCTTSNHGRMITRSFDERYLERVRSYHATEPYKKAMRTRQVRVEPLFAEAKGWHGLGRFRLRTLLKVNKESLLIATGQNLKRLLSWRGWGRRPWPSGDAGLRITGTMSPFRPVIA